MASPLLETKFHVPRRRRGLVARSRLSERLSRGGEAALTLVSAPAGFGKTTMPAADDDGHARPTSLSIAYPERLNRWKPLYKWFLAIPHYLVLIALALASVVTVLWGAVAVIVTGEYPSRARRFLVGAYRYCLRVEAYVGLLTDQYPPFRMAD